MNKQAELIRELQTHPWIKKTQELKQLIESNPELLKRYQSILKLQQQIVQLTYQTHESQTDLLKSYHTALDLLLDDPLVSEYLTMIETVNDLFQSISGIFEQMINTPIGDE